MMDAIGLWRAARTGAAFALALHAAIALAVVGASVARADMWVLEKAYTEVRISWDNMGLARQSARFPEVEGSLQFSPTDPEGGSLEVRIRTDAIQTGSAAFSDLLRRPEFFNAPAHPTITFKSTGVRRTGHKAGIVEGELTILGMTRPVSLTVDWNFTGAHPMAAINAAYTGKWVSGFSARTKVNRSEWGLSRGVPLVSDEIEIAIEAEFTRKGE